MAAISCACSRSSVLRALPRIFCASAANSAPLPLEQLALVDALDRLAAERLLAKIEGRISDSARKMFQRDASARSRHSASC